MKKYFLVALVLFSKFSEAQWITLAPMPTVRQEMPSVVLDGKIYTAGGISQLGATLNTLEIYDPATNTWSTGVPMPAVRHHHAMCVLDNKIYVIGGYSDILFTAATDLFMYNPDSLKWFTLTALPYAIGAADAVGYNGKLYFIGGTNGSNALNICWQYDPAADSWAAKSNMPTAREHLCVALVNDLIFAIAGRGTTGADTIVEIYNPNNDTWTNAPHLPTGRSGCDATVANGKIFVLGGEGNGIYNENEMYNPANQTWYTLDSMPHARHGLGVVSIGDTVYAIGGATSPNFGPCNLNEAFITTSVPSSAQTLLSEESFFLSPNPFSEILHYTNLNFKTETLPFSVVDILGKEIFAGRLSKQNVELETGNWKPGIYFFKINYTVKKIVKQ